jgi:hypothetical protein
MHAEKLRVHFVSGYFFSDFGPRQLPFLPQWLTGLGPLSNVITRNRPLFGSMFGDDGPSAAT